MEYDKMLINNAIDDAIDDWYHWWVINNEYWGKEQ